MGFRNSANHKQQYKFKLKLPDWFDEKGFQYRETSTGEVMLEMCPKCGKHDYKLYVDPETGVAQCKHASCDWVEGVSPMQLVQELLDCSKKEAFLECYEIPEQKPRTSIFDDSEENESAEYVRKEKEKKEVPTIDFPSGSVDLTQEINRDAWDYLLGRGYTKEIIEKLKIKILPFNDYKDAWSSLQKTGLNVDQIKTTLRYLNRVIFPLYINDELKGYIARDFTGLVPKQFKVFNSVGHFRQEYFWNYDNVKNNKEEIVICEGISDAMKCGVDRSIALLGTASANQLNLLKTIQPKKVIICLDIGTEKIQNFIYEELALEFAGNIFCVDLPPLLYQKEDILNDNIINALREGNSDIKILDAKSMIIPFEVLHDVKVKLKHKWYNLADEDYELLNKFVKTAQYKDAGDYSIGEMNEYINNAVPYIKKVVPVLTKID